MRMKYKTTLLLLLLSVFSVAEPIALAHDCEHEARGTVRGAVLGGAIGFLLGGRDNRLAGTLIGGAAGALIGNAVGREIDEADRCEFSYAYNNALEHNTAGYAESWSGPRGHGEIRIIQTGYTREDHQECRQWGSTYFDAYGSIHQESGYVCRTKTTWVERKRVIWADSDSVLPPYADSAPRSNYDAYHDDSMFISNGEPRQMIRQLRFTYSSREQFFIVQNFTRSLVDRRQFIRNSDRQDILNNVNSDVRYDVRDMLWQVSR